MFLSWGSPSIGAGLSYEIKQSWTSTQDPTDVTMVTLPLEASPPHDDPQEDMFTVDVSIEGASAVVGGWLRPGQAYVYEVRAVRGTNASAWSDEESARVPSCEVGDTAGCILLGFEADMNGTVANLRDGKLTFSWDDTQESNARYHVHLHRRGDLDGGGFLPYEDHRSSTTNRGGEMTQLVAGETYDFRILALTDARLHESIISVPMPARIPVLGHQADHTVKYEVISSTIPTTFQPTVASAVSTSVAAWDTAMDNTFLEPGGPDIQFCTGQCSRNTDGESVRIVTSSGEHPGRPGEGRTESVVDARTPNIPVVLNNRVIVPVGYGGLAGDGDCGTSIACVGPRTVGDAWAFTSDANNHMADLIMVIEEPAWRFIDGKHKRQVWTNDRGMDGKDGPFKGSTYVYLPWIVMHEFGHTAGLKDLDPDEYPGYLMALDHVPTAIAIPLKDIYYIREGHRNAEHGSQPHDQ